MRLLRNLSGYQPVLSTIQEIVSQRSFHASASLNRISVGRYKPTKGRVFPLTYDMAMKPHDIVARKAWKSWNTSNLKNGKFAPEILIEDAFIREFMTGTWTRMLASEIIIKRQTNMIRISAFVTNLKGSKHYFLLGYTEEFLSIWFRCPVKLEIVSVDSVSDLIYQYI